MATGQPQHPPADGNTHSTLSAPVGPAYPAVPTDPLPAAGASPRRRASGRSCGETAPPRGRRAEPGRERTRRSPGARRSRGCCDCVLGDTRVPLPAVEHAGAVAVTAEHRRECKGSTDRSVRCGGDIPERSAHTAMAVMRERKQLKMNQSVFRRAPGLGLAAQEADERERGTESIPDPSCLLDRGTWDTLITFGIVQECFHCGQGHASPFAMG